MAQSQDVADIGASDRHPLKQGLKPVSLADADSDTGRASDRHPLKQGLKPESDILEISKSDSASDRTSRGLTVA